MKTSNLDVRNLLGGLAIPLLGITLLLSLGGYLGAYHQLLELMSHFKVQYLVLSLVAFLLLSISRYKKWWLISIFCLALNSVEVLPWYIPLAVQSRSTPPLRVMVANVLTSNQQYDQFLDLVKIEKPAVLVTMEINPTWQKQLETLKPLLPYSIVQPRFDNFGIAIYSSFPLENATVQSWSATETDIPSLTANINWQGQMLELIATHPLPPIRSALFQSRNHQLVEVANYVRSLSHPTIVMGDLNASLWSPQYRQLVRSTGLQNSRRGFGVQPSWAVDIPGFRIPIDHCLVSPTIQVVNNRIGRDVGSDHYPVICELELE
jgi:endonuclease/exonuclease/phosphatase (EEP) superfamily protein YafD